MSRTRRKPAWYVEHSDVSFINRELARYGRRPYKLKKVLRDKDEYDRLVIEARKEFEDAVKKNGGSVFYTYSVPWDDGPRIGTIRERYVNRFKYVRVDVDVEEVVKEAKAYRARLTRDGRMSETTSRTGFKQEANRHVRRANKRFCDAVLRDAIDDDHPVPIRKEGKTFKWGWW